MAKSAITNQGFTLIELMVVLVVLVISSAVVIPNIGSGQNSAKLQGAARSVASALRYLRGQALVTNSETVFTVDLEKNQYRVSGREKNFQIPEIIDITLVTAQSELSGEGEGRIRFYPDGSSTGGRVTLEIEGDKKLVDVNWLTGQVDITDKYEPDQSFSRR